MDSAGSEYINSLLPFYRHHTEKVILPFWESALDHKNGGIYTCFTNQGDRLINTDKYSWSQGRYLWLWSKIAPMISSNKLQSEPGVSLGHLHKTVQFLEQHALLDNGNCAFLLSETGEKKESIPGEGYDTSIYADCFIAMGFAAYAELFKDLDRLETAVELYKNISGRIRSGKYRSEPYPIPVGYRAHSIPMILLNVARELADVAETFLHPVYEEMYQDSIVYMNDIMMNFRQPDHSIAEFVSEESSNENTLMLRHRNPGHTIESMWFVMQTAQKAGRSDYIQKASQSIKKAVESGWDVDFDGLFRFVDREDGKPKGEKMHSSYEFMITDTWDMKLWWPHSEALYATLLAFSLTRNEFMLELHKKIHKYTFRTFPNPDKITGEWIQIRDRRGKPLDKVAALPVKDPFHILRSLVLIQELLDKQFQTETK